MESLCLFLKESMEFIRGNFYNIIVISEFQSDQNISFLKGGGLLLMVNFYVLHPNIFLLELV